MSGGDERGPLAGDARLLERTRLGERTRLIEAARLLNVALTDAAAERLLRLLDELTEWSQAYSLTSIREREAMLTRHLLDSLSIHEELEGETVADVGAGAGFPGLPLAVVNPERRFTLVDSSAKKVRFLAHAVRTLALENVSVAHARAEELHPRIPFDTVAARAFAALPELLATVRGLCGPRTRVLAMKGRYPSAEIAAVRPPWRIVRSRPLRIPGLEEERHLIVAECADSDTIRP